MKKRMLINMQGGLIQSITTNFVDLEIVVMDYDLPETEPLEDIYLKVIEPSLVICEEIFTDDPDVFDLDSLNKEEYHFLNCLKELGW